MTDVNTHYLNDIDNLLKSKNEKKKEEYYKKQKEKKAIKKKTKKGNKEEKIEKNNFYNKKEEDKEIESFLREENIEIEYIDEDQHNQSKFYNQFKDVLEYFVIPKKQEKKEESEDEDEITENEEIDIDGMPIEEKKEEKISKKKRKQMKRMKISDLKAFTTKPEVVEAWDVTAQDPIFLINLKTLKNTIAVPKHWCQKRRFLQNKRGIIKPPLELPDFIENTGISKIRDNNTNVRKVLKQKLRERMQPKLGKMDIDYQVLYDAFFKHQTKPASLTKHGDIYYENKEYENKMRIFKPGRISEKLRVALGIPENSHPPFIINMQRYGPPPSYPNLKIPGVNAPILDPTAEVTPNLWTPPVAEVKAVAVYDFKKKHEIEHWGDVREADEDEYSEMDDNDLSISDVDDNEKIQVEGIFSGMGMDEVNENTKAIGDIDMTNAVPNPNANINTNTIQSDTFYSVLEQKNVNIKDKEIYGSTFGYVMPEDNKEEKQIKQEEQAKPKEKPKDTKYKFKF
jgi:splicing factor 3B subunit 2